MKRIISLAAAAATCIALVFGSLDDAGLTFQKVSAEPEYDAYSSVLKEFVKLHGEPQNNRADDYGNISGTFCRLIDFNNDGISELYLGDSEEYIVQIYALKNGSPALVYENPHFNTMSIDEFEGIIHHMEDDEYYIYNYEFTANANILRWYTFDGSSFGVKEKFAMIHNPEEFDSTGYRVVKSWDDNVLTEGFELCSDVQDSNFLFYNLGCGSMWFAADNAYYVSSETYNKIVKETDNSGIFSGNTEEDYERDFINHHAGIAKLQGDRSIWEISSDVTTLAELIKFDYFYGNTGISFATDAYANIGNPIEIIEAGQKSRDIYSSVSLTMYYKALLGLMYDPDTEDLYDLTKEYYTDTLGKFLDYLKTVNLNLTNGTDLVQSVTKMLHDVTECRNFKELYDLSESFSDKLDLTELPIKDLDGKNVSVGVGDVLSLLSTAAEMLKDAGEDEADLMLSVVYFRLFRDLQTDQKEMLAEMYSNVPEGDEYITYKTALKNINESISVPNIEAFITLYFLKGNIDILKNFNDDCVKAIFSIAVSKIIERIPGGYVLNILDIIGQNVDKWFDDMNSTEEKIISIGEFICHLQIAESLQIIGDQYGAELIKDSSFPNAVKYHDTVCLYYRALSNCCYYGNTFLDLFVSSYYSVQLDSDNNILKNMRIIDKDKIVFKYFLTSFENKQADDYLNKIFGTNGGDYFTWYKQIIILNANIKDLYHFYKNPICCTEKTEEEINEMLEAFIEEKSKKAADYIKNKFSAWRTSFIGCPVSVDVFSESGEAVATINGGNIDVHNSELFMNIFCYTLEEQADNTEDISHGTLLMTPSEYTFTITAQEDCQVLIQQTESGDLSGITLSAAEWNSDSISLIQGDVLQSSQIMASDISGSPNSLIIKALLCVLISILISIILSATVIVLINRRERKSVR